MGIYVLNFISIPIYSMLIKRIKLNNSSRKNKLYIMIVGMQMFLISSLRASYLGDDLGIYKEGFCYISNLNLFELLRKVKLLGTAELIYPYKFESGYVVFNWVISRFTDDFQVFLIVVAFLVTLSVSKFIYRYSKIPWLSYIIFAAFVFYKFSFGILRQTLALSILLYSVPYIGKSKPIKFIMYILIAFLFHRTALIFIFLYPISKIKINGKLYIVCIYMLCFGMLFGSETLKLIINIAEYFNLGLGLYNNADISFKMNNLFIIILIILALSVIFGNKYEINSSNGKIIFHSVILSLILELLGLYNDLFARIVIYNLIFIIIQIPNVMIYYKKNRFYLPICIVTFFMMLGFMIYDFRESLIVPYVFFWE